MSEQQNKPAVVKQQQPGIIMPAVTAQEAVQAFRAYQELKNAVGDPEDFQTITDKKGNTSTFPKKSFVRKIQRFFEISCQIIQDEPLYDKKGERVIAWLAKVRAVHTPTGAFQEADGSCGIEEKPEKQQTLHNLRSHAVTRAKNRAVMDLVGFGDVTAEEIAERATPYKRTYQRPTYQQAAPQRKTMNQDDAIQRGRKKVRELAEEKKLNGDNLRKLIKYQTGKEDLNKLDVLELRDLVVLMQEMSGEDLLNLIGERAIEDKIIEVEATTEDDTVVNLSDDTGIDPAEVEEVMK